MHFSIDRPRQGRGGETVTRFFLEISAMRQFGLGVLVLVAALWFSQQHAQAQATPPSASRDPQVGLYVSPPFVYGEPDAYQGMAIELWEMISGELGIGSRFVVYPSIRDLIGALSAGEIEAAVTNLTITRKRAEAVAFTQPWYDAGMRIMVKEEGTPGFGRVLSGLRSAGHLRAYAWLAFVIVLSTILLTLFDRRFDKDFPRRWREGIAESFHHVMSIATTGKASRKNLFGWVGRIWASLWLVFGVAVVAYITSSVTSVMTAVSIEQEINSLTDLPGKTAGVLTGSSAEDHLNDLGIATRSYNDLDAAVGGMEEGRVDAIVADAPVLEYYAHHNPDRGTTVVGSLFHPDKYGFAFPQDSELMDAVTLKILEFQENGALEDLRLKYFGSAL